MVKYNKMTDLWILKEVISSKFNRTGSQKCTNRSILFLIEHKASTVCSLFQINKVNKTTLSLACNERKCSHRLSMQHFLPAEQHGKSIRNFKSGTNSI